MNTFYRDTQGKAWTFGTDGTPYQTLLFRKVLAAVRRAILSERLTLSYLSDPDANDAFCADVEAAVLSGLFSRFADPQGPAPNQATAPPPQPAEDDTDGIL